MKPKYKKPRQTTVQDKLPKNVLKIPLMAAAEKDAKTFTRLLSPRD